MGDNQQTVMQQFSNMFQDTLIASAKVILGLFTHFLILRSTKKHKSKVSDCLLSLHAFYRQPAALDVCYGRRFFSLWVKTAIIPMS